MAYINNKTFDIWRGSGTHEAANFEEDYFQADDAIALPIQILNRKGYATTSCCSEHPFRRLPHELTVRFDPLAKQREHPLRYRFRCSIGFKEGVTLPSLPPGFEAVSSNPDGRSCFDEEGREFQPPDCLIIQKFYNYDNANADKDAFAFMQDVLDAMKQLYQWALSLPDAAEIKNGGNIDGVHE